MFVCVLCQNISPVVKQAEKENIRKRWWSERLESLCLQFFVGLLLRRISKVAFDLSGCACSSYLINRHSAGKGERCSIRGEVSCEDMHYAVLSYYGPSVGKV